MRIATLALAICLAVVAVGLAQADVAARWHLVDSASDTDPQGYGTLASVSHFTDYGGTSLGARVRVRAPRGPVELDMNSDCDRGDRSVTRRYRSNGQWVLRPLPPGRGDCYYSVFASAEPGTLRLRLEVLE